MLWLRQIIKDISIKFEIQGNFAMFLLITYADDTNKILHTSRQ